MTPRRLVQRITECDRLTMGQRAEGQGLRAAIVFATPYEFSRDAYLQERFLTGFRDGQTLLALPEEVPDASHDQTVDAETADGGLRVGESDDPAVRTEPEAKQPSPYSG